MDTIFLTSYICEVLQRMLLWRLKGNIRLYLSKNLYGFLPGKSIHHYIHRINSNVYVRYTAINDLKKSIDRANHAVILAELGKYVQDRMLPISDEDVWKTSFCLF